MPGENNNGGDNGFIGDADDRTPAETAQARAERQVEDDMPVDPLQEEARQEREKPKRDTNPNAAKQTRNERGQFDSNQVNRNKSKRESAINEDLRELAKAVGLGDDEIDGYDSPTSLRHTIKMLNARKAQFQQRMQSQQQQRGGQQQAKQEQSPAPQDDKKKSDRVRYQLGIKKDDYEEGIYGELSKIVEHYETQLDALHERFAALDNKAQSERQNAAQAEADGLAKKLHSALDGLADEFSDEVGAFDSLSDAQAKFRERIAVQMDLIAADLKDRGEETPPIAVLARQAAYALRRDKQQSVARRDIAGSLRQRSNGVSSIETSRVPVGAGAGEHEDAAALSFVRDRLGNRR